MKKRMMAILMTAILVIASIPFTAFAEEAPAEVLGGEAMEAVAAEAAEAEVIPAAAGEEAEAAEPAADAGLLGADPTTVTTFADLKNAVNATPAGVETTIILGGDIKDMTTYLNIPAGKKIVLDLSGHTLDRGLKEGAAGDDGNVIKVAGASLTVKNGTITGSNSKGDGALCCDTTKELNVSNVNFADCKGGALRLFDVENANIEDCTFSGNTNNANGGAIYIWANNESEQKEVTIKGCLFEDNKTTNGSGSAICIFGKKVDGVPYYNVTIIDSEFTGNIAGEGSAEGGAICAYRIGSLVLDGCTITGNTSLLENKCGGLSIGGWTDKLTIRGKTVIRDNTSCGKPADLCRTTNEVKIFKVEDLDPESKIGYRAINAVTGKLEIAKGLKDSDIKCFFPDDPMCQLTAAEGSLFIEPAENHVDIEYKKAGGEIKHFEKYGADVIGAINIPEMLPEGDKDADIIGVKAAGNVEVSVNGKVDDPDSAGIAKGVTASGSARVTVTGDVKNTLKDAGTGDADNAVNAYDQAVVEIGGNIDSQKGDAIYANGPAAVTVDGNVTTHSDSGVNAENFAAVEIKGNIDSADYGVYVTDSDVTVYGDITSNAAAINAAGDSTVKVGGNVTDEDAISVIGDKATVVVEGTASGNISADGGRVFVGKLDGKMDPGTENYVCYLIGFSADGAGLKEFKFSGVSGAPSGVNGKTYNAVSANGIAGSQITITPKEAGKKIDTGKLVIPAGVTKVEKDGALILQFDENFKGGLQDMVITLDGGPKPDPTPSSGSSEPLFTGTWNNPVKNGRWTQDANGIWSYTTTQTFRSTWGYIENPFAGAGQNKAGWFYFDQYGHMLTGWQLVGGKWYYLNPTKDGTLGACLLGPGKTPDGWEIDETGAWTGK